MRLAVTGASGRVGAALVREALKRGHSLVLLGRQLPEDFKTAADCHVCDLTNPVASPDLIRALEGVDAAIHLAALIDTDPQDDDAAIAMFRTNVLGTGHLIDLLAKAKVPHLVVASSANIYDPRVPFADEETATRPLGRTLYLGSKIAQEAYARERCQKTGLGCAFLRLSSVVGSGDDIVSRFASRIAAGDEIVLSNPGYGADFLALQDAATGLLLAAEEKLEGDYNLSSGTRHTLSQIAAMIGNRMDRVPVVQFGDGPRAEDVGFPAIDCSKLRARGFFPEPLDMVIDQICAEFQQHHKVSAESS